MTTMLCKDIVGRRVRLLKTINGFGRVYRKGRVMLADCTHRGMFSLRQLKVEKTGIPGITTWRGAMRVPRSAFQVLS